MAEQVANVPSAADASFDSTVHGLRQDPVAFVTRLVQAHGDVVRLPFGERDLFLLADPTHIQEIFLGSPDVYKKRKDEATEQAYLGQIAGFVPLFDHEHVLRDASIMAEAAARADTRWRDRYQRNGGPFEVDMYREMMQITLEIVTRVLFNADSEQQSAELVEAILTMDHGYGFNPVEATLGEFMSPANGAASSEQTAAREKILAYLKGLVDQETGADDRPMSFLSTLVKYLGPEAAVGVGMTVMFAMHEVTATTLPWAWYLLAENPSARAELQAELVRVLGQRPPTSADAPNLVYTDMVLAETRRLYPSVWLVGRFLRQDVTLGGYRLPANSVALASQQLTHHDARFFPDPERFDPLRWTPEASAARPAYSYFPFSDGPRKCAGEEFAKLEDLMILATLAQHWRAELVPDQQPIPRPQKSNAPYPGIRMRLEPVSD